MSSVAALAVVARVEGKGALQPINATSHWLNGEGAGTRTGADWRHTGVGLATHTAATAFWAAIFVATGRRRPVAVTVLAAATDYIATPKRFTPGWEAVLSPLAMAAVYAAMAAGLAAAQR